MSPTLTSTEAGFTLVEVMVSLALFGLIALAGLALVHGVMGSRDRSEARIERLGALQRAMHVMTLDLEQIDRATLRFEDGVLAFRRASPIGPIEVSYALDGTTLTRQLRGFGAPRAQRLVPGVAAANWAFLVPDAGWRSDWPAAKEAPRRRPRAVALTLTLAADAGPAGTLRRVVELPAEP